ncbi:pyridine nucleotide-disulfide oxidoreductase [Corynebacterium yudongzhengii]|uniref:ferredoxin--NADP(+) reductase n=1 Tax=Corynebacterium yudongzhengii TaxID=2080740 RepID=A0A2U1T888_9CORY|nr:FAD-dependent oxidoreductase [Corynebacterium yudongzhengii]AWB82741.1 pyridine nucleotide-disulfide oxidoreductase [Corynebacterium yudongzhengii]PWC02199.1 pyridine nucleotide-disulfide oxidoreductase [Corynebacterium yudongzhengii]
MSDTSQPHSDSADAPAAERRRLRVAVIGAGPAGIYASDLLINNQDHDVQVDLFEKMPAPFGLIRYGVAPDHPRIKGIVKSLHRVLDKEGIRLIANVEIGKDITLDELQDYYDAVVISTGATKDRDFDLPGADAEGVHGAAEFVGFYDGNPLFERDWDLSAKNVAVIGVGNVGLDASRILAKSAEELHVTEIPDNVYEALKRNQAEKIHVFGRRGPAQTKFTPQELKELDHSENVHVIVDPEDIDYDEASETARANAKATDQVCQILEGYAMRDEDPSKRTLQIHLFESPVEVLTNDGKVVGLRTERTELDGTGQVRGTGTTTDWPVEAIYTAIGYRSDVLPGLPFDDQLGVIPNDGGHVLANAGGEAITGVYVTGWIKRGPIGLIGNTKSDAKQTTDMLFADVAKLSTPEHSDPDAILALLESRDVTVTTWDGWYRLDEAERAAGEAEGRERKKFVEWDEMVDAATAQ